MGNKCVPRNSGELDIPVIDQPFTVNNKNEQEFCKIKVGLVLMIRDEFQSKYSKKIMFKWRKAEIKKVKIDEYGVIDSIYIHFIGWSPEFDAWIDLQNDFDKIAPVGLMSEEECDKGIILSEKQLIDSRLHFHGKAYEDEIRKNTKSSSLQANSLYRVGKEKESLAKSSSSLQANTLYHVGIAIEALDIYPSTKETITKKKWRTAIITEATPSPENEQIISTIKIHYVGWSNKYDCVLDVIKDKDRIRLLNTVSENRDRPTSKNSDNSGNSTLDDSDNCSSNGADSPTFTTSNKKPLDGSINSELDLDDLEIDMSDHGDNNDDHMHRFKYSHYNHNNVDKEFEEMKAKQKERELQFRKKLKDKGFKVVEINGDGNCLFRAVSYQVFLTEEHHSLLRENCVKHLKDHRRRFEMFVDGDFDMYCKEMGKLGVWGDDVEIRALEEILDRIICIYSSESKTIEPLNKNFEEDALLKGVSPVNLTYHGNSHYNALVEQNFSKSLGLRNSSILTKARQKLFDINSPEPVEGSKARLYLDGDSDISSNEDSIDVDDSHQHSQNKISEPKFTFT